MNANELADTMEKEMVDGFCLGYIGDAVAMLRQQQAEIEELKGEVAHLKHINKNWAISEGWALKEIEALKRQCVQYEELGASWSQAKTLTDEEIDKVMEEFIHVKYEFNKAPPEFNYLNFAKAILRKANEK